VNLHVGDSVVHWTYGLGQVVRLEERVLSGSNTLYYAVQVADMTVWVPADGKLESRLRSPTPAVEFEQLLTLLSDPSEPLPEDRHERRTHLLGLIRDGRAESLCRMIRDLSAHQKIRSLNDNDQTLLKQARAALLGEMGFALSITHAQAEIELHRLLAPKLLEIAE
jgi:RNA polymerase-interacting CarD/CdnL/TRCF family regulator